MGWEATFVELRGGLYPELGSGEGGGIPLGEKDKEDKRRNTKWIRDLNDIRNRVSHPERGGLDRVQVEWVREIHGLVEKYIAGGVA